MITRNEFLELTDGGLKFYKNVIPDLKIIRDGYSEVSRNPFRDCPLKTFYIFKKGHQWFYQDLVWHQDHGNVFKFGASHYKTNYQGHLSEIIFAMLHDLINLPVVEIHYKMFKK